MLAGGAFDLLLLGEQALELGISLTDEGLDLLFGLRRRQQGPSRPRVPQPRGPQQVQQEQAAAGAGAAGRVDTTRGRSVPAVSPTAIAASLAIFCSSVLL